MRPKSAPKLSSMALRRGSPWRWSGRSGLPGFYLKLREYYQLTHTPADLAVWEAEAEETCRAMPPAAAVPPAQDCVPEGLLSGGHGHDDGAETVNVPNPGA